MIAIMGKPLTELFDRAAIGNADAQSALVQYSLNRIREGHVTFEHGVQVAEAFARLAAARKRPSDLMTLAGVLMYVAQVEMDRGQVDESATRQTEALAVLSDLADQGDETAAVALQNISDALTPAVIADAGRLLRANEAQAENDNQTSGSGEA